MRFYRFALSALCVALICPAHAEEAGAEAPPARRAAVIVYPVSRRPQEHLAAPGEWLVIADRHGLWMPHFFADAPTQTYHKRGSEVYLRRQVGRDELVGVQMKSLTGRLEVRSALAAKTDPLTIWAYASVIPEIPALPPGGRYALAVDGVSDLRPLTRLRGLTALKLGCAPGVTDLAPLAALTELDSLWLSGADASDLAPLAALPKLRVLRIDLCKGVTDLSPLARLKNLRLLDLDCSGAPTNAAALARLRHLNVLVVRRCPSLLDLAPIAQLDGLNWLGLHGCPLVADLAPLRRLPRLATLEVEACPGVSDLAPLASMATLEGLSLRACPKVADISPLATLPRLVRMEVVDCPRVMDLWPLRRAAQQPHNFSVDWRLGDEAALNAQASPGKVTLLMDGRYVSSVAMPPEAIGEDDGWGNLLSRSIVPPAGLPEGVQELPYPVAPDQADSVLNFTLEGPRVFLSDPHGPRRLAGVVACSHESRLALQQALAEGAKGLLVWATADAIKSLPSFPPGSDCTLVVLGFRPSIEPLGRVKNLAGLYVAHASDQASSLGPIAQLTGLKSLVLRGTPRADSLKRLSRMAGLTSLDLSLSPSVRNLKPLAALTGLTTLRLTCTRPVDFTPLASLPNLTELTLETGEDCTDLSSLARLTQLRMLSLTVGGASVPRVHVLPHLPHLTALRLAGFGSLTDLSAIASLPKLEVLIFRSCGRLRDLRPLAAAPGLRYLDITGCPRAADIPILRHLQTRNVQLVMDTHLWPQLSRARLDLTQAPAPAAVEP